MISDSTSTMARVKVCVGNWGRKEDWLLMPIIIPWQCEEETQFSFTRELNFQQGNHDPFPLA